MILTIGPSGSGLTFLNWSIVFLRGDNNYQRLNGSLVEVDIDPLNGLIAHKFFKDHVQTSSDLHKLNLGHSQTIIYVTPCHQEDFDYATKFSCKKIVFDCKDRQKDLLARMITCVPQKVFDPLIEKLSNKFGSEQATQMLLECSSMFTSYYSIPQPSEEYFVISYDDIFLNLDCKIKDVFEFLKYDIDQDRWNKWLNIYTTYKQNNMSILSNFETKYVDIPSSIKMQMLTEIIKWRNGSYHST